jgi:hypothetical protein
VIHPGITSNGCGWLPSPWRLTITDAPGKPGPGNPIRAAFAAPDQTARQVSIWITVDADGAVQTGVGIPDWWTGDVQACPSS